MDEPIFYGYGLDIFKRAGRLFIRYDSGGIDSRMIEQEIIAEDAKKAKKSERDAHEVLVTIKKRLGDLNMGELIFSGYGVDIFRRAGRLFIRYDSGGIASRMIEQEITGEEAEKAKKSERDAYEVLIAIEKRL